MRRSVDIAPRLKRLSVHPNAQQQQQPDAQQQPGAGRIIRRQLARAATLKRFHVSHRNQLAEERMDNQGALARLMPAESCGSRLLVCRFVAAAGQYIFQWFSDPAQEREYMYFAYVPRVGRLACMLYAGGIGYAMLSAVDAIAQNGLSLIHI